MPQTFDVLAMNTVIAIHRSPLFIAGTVTVEGEPALRRPRLYLRASGKFVAETESGPDGSFEFFGLRDSRYYVIATDPTLQFEAVLADNIQPATNGGAS